MVAVSSKRALIICPDSDSSQTTLGHLIARELEHGNMPVLTPSPQEIHWRELKDVKNYFAVHQPRVAICVLPLGRALFNQIADPTVKETYFSTLKNVAAACAKSGCVPIFLSDYHVFGKETKNAYIHTDPTEPLDEFGVYLQSLEELVSQATDQHIVLRLSWLIDIDNDNLLTRILNCLHGGGQLALSRHRRGSPTWTADVVRVVCGVIRQVMSGAENWGYFHYCSADNCNEVEFADAVKSVFAEITPPIGELIEHDHNAIPVDDLAEPASATLTCLRIKNNFGIHGRSWRQGLTANVSRWLAARGVVAEEQVEASHP